MTHYFIDYENVNRDGLNGISSLSEEDAVTIFYSQNADTMSFELHQRLMDSSAKVSFEKVECKGKNALDFQLISYLGWTIAHHPEDSFTIVTKDNGYQSAAAFWEKRNVKVTIVPELAKAETVKENAKVMEQVSSMFEDEEEAKEIASYILKYKTKQGINNALVKKYDSKRGGEVYQMIKPLLKGKKGR